MTLAYVSKVLLHELAHNRFDDHDDDFKARRWALVLAPTQTSPTNPDPSPSPNPSPNPDPSPSPSPSPNGLQALNSELGREYRAHRDAHRGARSASDHAVAATAPQEVDEELERALHPGYTLGEGAAAAEAAVAAAARPGYSYPLDVRAAAARAALRRATQGCVECVDDEPPGEQSR